MCRPLREGVGRNSHVAILKSRGKRRPLREGVGRNRSDDDVFDTLESRPLREGVGRNIYRCGNIPDP